MNDALKTAVIYGVENTLAAELHKIVAKETRRALRDHKDELAAIIQAVLGEAIIAVAAARTSAPPPDTPIAAPTKANRNPPANLSPKQRLAIAWDGERDFDLRAERKMWMRRGTHPAVVAALAFTLSGPRRGYEVWNAPTDSERAQVRTAIKKAVAAGIYERKDNYEWDWATTINVDFDD